MALSFICLERSASTAFSCCSFMTCAKPLDPAAGVAPPLAKGSSLTGEMTKARLRALKGKVR